MNLDQLTWKKQFLSEKNGIILDVRTPEEFEISRIPNSKNIDFYNPQNFMQEIEKLDRTIITTCIVEPALEVLIHAS